MSIHTSYLRPALNASSLNEMVRLIVKGLKAHDDEFDGIAFRGMSGALVAPMVAAKMDKKLLMVRKGEARHSYYDMEGDYSTEKYVVIDDQICSGDTIRKIKETIKQSHDNAYGPNCEKPKMVGIVLYYQDQDDAKAYTDSFNEDGELIVYGVRDPNNKKISY